MSQMKLAKMFKPAKKSVLIGHIDAYKRGYLSGWACDKENPGVPLRVRVVVQGRPQAEVLANKFRPDLKQSNIGDGEHGFEVHFPLSLAEGEAVDIRLQDADTGQRIQANPFQLKRQRRGCPHARLGARKRTR